jgi:hypothetical protein
MKKLDLHAVDQKIIASLKCHIKLLEEIISAKQSLVDLYRIENDALTQLLHKFRHPVIRKFTKLTPRKEQ